MDERHNEIMKYVLDEPYEAALELEQLRKFVAESTHVNAWTHVGACLLGFALGVVIG